MSGAPSGTEQRDLGRIYDAMVAEKHRRPLREVVRAGAREVARRMDALPRRVPSDGSRVEEVPALTGEALQRLFTHRSCGIHVRGYVPRETCRALADWMVDGFRFQKWEEASTGSDDLSDMFYGVGLPVNSVGQSRELCTAYFTEAVPTIRKVRAAAGDHLSPVDKLRLELDELWLEGANVRVDPLFKRKNLVGLGRLMRPDGMVGDTTKKNGIIHVDAWPHLSLEQGLFSANVYLRTPARGGELDVWGVAPGPAEAMLLAGYLDHAFDPPHREHSQKVLRDKLPPPHTVTMQEGDLVIINAGRPHAVRGFDEDCRVTLQSFIAYTRDEPLKLFA